MTEQEEDFTFGSFWKQSILEGSTRNILVIILAVFIISWIISLSIYGFADFIEFFSLSGPILESVGQYNRAVRAGHVYQLITSIFVHFDWLHLLSNCLFLLIFGLRAEEELPPLQYYLIFILSGLLGGVISLFAYSELTISAGASGGVFGLLGASLTLVYQSKKRKSLWGYLGAGVIFLVLMSSGMQVNLIAHSIGLVTGLALPFLLRKRKDKEDPIIDIPLEEV